MNITRGKIETAKKVVIYGPEGIGKSTFAAQFPDPLFIDTEGSTKHMDVNRMDKPTSWEMIKQQVSFVKQNRPCSTLIIDTFDWAEQLCIEHICSSYDKKGIEDFGYGNGYVYEKEEVGKFLNLLDEIIDVGINVVVTAHAQIRKFEQPDELGAYDRWELKLGKKTASQISPLIKEWADIVLFANYKTFAVQTDEKGKKFKAQGGLRVMYTQHNPCWDAKNRFGLAEEVPFAYEQIAHIFNTVTAPEIKQNVTAQESMGVQSAEPVQTDPIQEDIPKPLRDLMNENNVNEEEIRMAVSLKGYYPYQTEICNYDENFINGVLVGAWPQVFKMIQENRENHPFQNQ